MLVEKDRGNFWMLNWLDQYMVGHKGFIAGGCFKNIFCKEKVKDIDIFFESLADYEDAVNYFDSMTPGYEGDDKRDEEYIFHYQNDKVKAYKNAKTGIRVELCKAVFGTAKEVISRFDFTIVKFAYYKEEVEDETGAEFDPFDFDGMEELAEYHMEKKPETHIEYKIVCDENFFEHLHLKRLVTDDKIPFPMSTFERMIRYIGYGYRPCRETKVKIATAIHDLSEQEIVTGESLYDGMD